jgi:hydroxymethylbilane synthase
MRVTIASRRSDLARIQAYQVGEALSAAHPQIEINYSFHESLGDRNQNDPLWQMPEKGVFTQDFRAGLLGGDFDLVVHSWKDLTIEDDPETEIAATLARADARDLLLVREDRWAEVERTGAMSILTSSPRRAYNLHSFLREGLPAKVSELNFVNIRGNVPTRVRKLFQSDVDGLVVAKAALDRLLEAKQTDFANTKAELRDALLRCRWMVMPLRENPSAPAQGALAVEISRARDDLRSLLAPINSPGTFAMVARERAILAGYGGGCHQKIGVSVLRRDFGEIIFVRGVTDAGIVLDSCSLESRRSRPEKALKQELWPLDSAEARLFDSEAIPFGQPDISRALWIAKAEALPADWKIQSRQIVWCSGLQTWRHLAKRGVWVNGCAESLGEHESPRIETIAGSELEWLKLTHTEGYEGAMPALATYRLVPRNRALNLTGSKHFFWKSGSSFEYALSHHPWLKEMNHYCGAGNTQRILERNGIEPHVFLDHAQWLEEMSVSEPGAVASEARNANLKAENGNNCFQPPGSF